MPCIAFADCQLTRGPSTSFALRFAKLLIPLRMTILIKPNATPLRMTISFKPSDTPLRMTISPKFPNYLWHVEQLVMSATVRS